MSELRWILLAAGIALLVAIYVMGVRARRRSASPAAERITQRDTTRTPPRQEPRVVADPAEGDDDALETTELDTGHDVPRAAAADKPGLPHRHDRKTDPGTPEERTAPPRRREPTLGARLEPTQDDEAAPVPEMTAARDEPSAGKVSPAPAEPPRKGAEAPAKPRSKIVALRVAAPLPTRFSGAQLLEALQAERFEFGRFDIFHRLDDRGRPVFSLANLLEPGTFDLDTMQQGAYPGVALFAVLPGPLPAVETFDQLVATAKALAARLGGSLQDERGAWLSAQHIASLREELLAGESSARTGGGG